MPWDMDMPDESVLYDIPDDVDGYDVLQDWYASPVSNDWKANWVEENYKSETAADAPVTLQDMEETRGKEYTGFEKFRAGVGQGMTNIARNVGNITGFVSDEDMADAAELDAPLLDTSEGMVGSLTGEVAALAPLSGIGAAAKVGKVVQATKGLSKSRAAALAAEGAAGGAIASGPNNRGSGAATGALFGGGLGAASDVAGRLGKGFVKATSKPAPDAVALEKTLGKELSHAIVGKDGFFKFTLREMIPYLPGGGTVAKQFKEADEDIVKVALKMATPDGVDVKDVAGLEKAFAKGYDKALGGRSMDFANLDWAGVSEPAYKEVAKIVSKYSVDGVVTGKNIAKARAKLVEYVDNNDLPGLDTVMKQFDDFVEQNLMRSVSGKAVSNVQRDANKRAVDMYKGLSGKYDNFRRVAKAGEAQEGLTTSSLKGAARELSPAEDAVGHTGPMQKFADTAAGILGKELPNPSLWGRIAALSSVGGLIGGFGYGDIGSGAVGSVLATTFGYALGRGGGSRGFQRFMSGRSGLQKGIQSVRGQMPQEALSVASQSKTQQELQEEGY